MIEVFDNCLQRICFCERKHNNVKNYVLMDQSDPNCASWAQILVWYFIFLKGCFWNENLRCIFLIRNVFFVIHALFDR